MGPDTVAVHGGKMTSARLTTTGDLSTTYRTPDLPAATASIDAMARTRAYRAQHLQRLHNPTVDRFEALAQMEEPTARSPMLRYGRSHRCCWPPRWSVRTSSRFDRSTAARTTSCSANCSASRSHGRPRTRSRTTRDDTSLVICGRSNPLSWSTPSRRRGGGWCPGDGRLLCDAALQQPAAHGAAIVLHSGTKFLGGHGDVMARVLATNNEWVRVSGRCASDGWKPPPDELSPCIVVSELPIRVRAAQPMRVRWRNDSRDTLQSRCSIPDHARL